MLTFIDLKSCLHVHAYIKLNEFLHSLISNIFPHVEPGIFLQVNFPGNILILVALG